MTARVHHAELWGRRQAKYDWLAEHDLTDTPWAELDPAKPFYLFTPQDTELLDEYRAGWGTVQAFPENTVGVVTGQDSKTIAFDQSSAERLARSFQLAPETVCSILYRPFDERFIVYHPSAVTRPRAEVMRHMRTGENIGLLTTRQTRDAFGALATRRIAAHKAFSAYDITSLFPLYLYPEPGKMLESSPWPAGKGGRRPNLTPEFVEEFAGKLGLTFVPDGRGDLKKTFGPEDVFHYAYAVFHSPTYRRRYAEFLKIDFPRLPLTSEWELFARLCGLGAELVSLHLLEAVPPPRTTYPQAGSNRVERTGGKAYKPPTSEISDLKSRISDHKSVDSPSPGRVYVNDEQYFEDVPPEVWGFHVGGYQVCEKWLKDRKGRTLGYDDIETYRKITEAIRQTIRLMDEIDAAIPAWPIG